MSAQNTSAHHHAAMLATDTTYTLDEMNDTAKPMLTRDERVKENRDCFESCPFPEHDGQRFISDLWRNSGVDDGPVAVCADSHLYFVWESGSVPRIS